MYKLFSETKWIAWSLCLLIFVTFQSARATPNRVALVIGNSDYKDAPLKNPSNDATDMARKLTTLGFKVDKLINADYRQMTKAIQSFGKKLRHKNTVGLFYFAGHGVQLDSTNYLLPIKANIESEADIEFEAVNAVRVLQQMEHSENNLNIVILDACRNNPFARSFRSASRGLAKMEAPKGSMILYATSPGNVAADGDGRNGLFTEKLLKQLSKKGLKIEDVFKQTAKAVSQASGKKQYPYIEGYILGDFYFTGPVSINKDPIQVTSAYPDIASKQETVFWESVEASPSKEMYEYYLKKYPNGHYAGLAKLKIKQQMAVVPFTKQAEFEPEALVSSKKKSGKQVAYVQQRLGTKNSSSSRGDGRWDWRIFIDADKNTMKQIQCVTYSLHKTFPNPVRKVCDSQSGFALSSNGWGTFRIKVEVGFKNGSKRTLYHDLKFN